MYEHLFSEAVRAPHVNVSAMATIVQELVMGGPSSQHSSHWLRERAKVAGLSTQEYQALEALRVRVCERAATLSDTTISATWA